MSDDRITQKSKESIHNMLNSYIVDRMAANAIDEKTAAIATQIFSTNILTKESILNSIEEGLFNDEKSE